MNIPPELWIAVAGLVGALAKSEWERARERKQKNDYRDRWIRQIDRTAQAAAVPRAPDAPPPLSLPPPSGDWDEESKVRNERELREQQAMDRELQDFIRRMQEAERTPPEPVVRRRMKSVRRGDD